VILLCAVLLVSPRKSRRGRRKNLTSR